jgi:CarboxypepD_reg-like domain/TonB-dependent Receptor Plug Domain
MKMPFFLYCLFFSLWFSTRAHGQSSGAQLLHVALRDASIKELVSVIESQTDLHFYYDKSQFDSLKINIAESRQGLQMVMELAFAGTNFHYSIFGNQVFLTKDRTLSFSLTGIEAAVKMTPGKEYPGNGYQENEGDEHKLIEIGNKADGQLKGPATIAGFITDYTTGEPLAGASILVEKMKIGTSTDQYGYYSLSLPRGRYVVDIQNIGMRDTRRQIFLYGDGKLNIEMQSTIIALRKVVISAQKISNVKGTQMGFVKLDIKAVKQVPVVFGEADVLKVITTLPGVKTVGEASTGLNVRGGAADQNLILFNDATIYNPSHFFGMFSAFNPEVVKDVELYKSTIPPKYGGRLSSVVNISSREGNKKEVTGTAGIGPLTSRLEVEGPLVKDKSSFILGGRTTYADWLLNLLPAQYKNSRASFYDANLNISNEIDKNNSFYVTGYLSQDRFNLNSDTFYGYGNKNIGLKWKHIFGNKLNGTFSTGYDRYDYDISSQAIPQAGYKLSFDINQYYLKADFNDYFSNQQTFNFGVNSLLYKIHPGNYQPEGEESLVMTETIAAEQALESSIYFNDHYVVNSAISIDAGVRGTIYNYLGPQEVNYYQPGIPKSTTTIIRTVDYGSGSVIKTYGAPEFRFSVKYAFSDSTSLKAGFSNQRQYIHSISNTTAMAPTDIWKLSDPNIKPQSGEQVSLGIYKNLKSNTIETSVEVYYKHMDNYLDYKSGAVLIMNPHLETDVLETQGKAYGVEFFIKKLTGKLNGWISYAWSRTFLRMNDSTQGTPVNNGAYYPADYDIPNNVAVVGNYRVSHRFSMSWNGVYATGRPITLPVGTYYYAGAFRTLYTNRNQDRIPDYFRMDFSMNIDGNYRIHQLTHNSWTIGVYNLTGRKNAYSVYYVSENGVIDGYKLSIFGSAIPYINYNIRF